MSRDNTMSRTLHDLGLSAWFGGSLLDVVAPGDQGRSSREAIGLAAMGMYGLGSLGLTYGNRGRLGAQRGVASLAAAKAAVSVAAMGGTLYAAYLRRRSAQGPQTLPPDDAASEAIGGDGSAPQGESDRRLTMVRAAVPVLTGALVVMNARMGEQQRPLNVVRGVAERVGHALPERERITDVLPERITDVLPERITEALPERIGDVIPERIAGLLPESISDLVPERVAARF